MKKRVNMSLDDDTIERLRKLSKERHMNVSTLVTFLAWKEELKDEQLHERTRERK